MADIVKKKNDGEKPVRRTPAGQVTEWNPLRVMRNLLRWDPFREMAPMFPRFPELERMGWNPSFEVTENQDSYRFKVDVPGVKREDLEIRITGNRLQISGKREAEKEARSETVHTCERSYGSFVRSFTLPGGADLEHARSELQDGVLTLVIPKLPGAQAKKIPISAGGAKS